MKLFVLIFLITSGIALNSFAKDAPKPIGPSGPMPPLHPSEDCPPPLRGDCLMTSLKPVKNLSAPNNIKPSAVPALRSPASAR